MSAVARTRPRPPVFQSPKPGTVVDEDGGLYITAEQLARFGNGDAVRGRRELRNFLAVSGGDSRVFEGPTERPMTVRLGREADEAAILELLILDLKENAEFVAPIDEARVLECIRVGTRLRGGFAAVIDGPDGKPVAVTILHPTQWFWSQGWYFSDVVSFVHPDHRRSHHADDLIAFGKWVVDEQTRGFGYRVYLICGVMGMDRLWAKTAMFRRKATQVGSGFCYPTPRSGGAK